MASTNQNADLKSCDPAQTEESGSSHSAAVEASPNSAGPVEVQPLFLAPLPQDFVQTVKTFPNPDESFSPSCSETHMSCSDLMSLRSDSVSMSGSRRSEWSQEEDVQSVTTSSVMSMMQRVPLGPLEKDWIRSCAAGNSSVQRVLLQEEPSLIHRKDFITGFTGLHWAAKLGLQESVGFMIQSGADINARSHGGYTPLHLASIHGHRHIVLALVNIYNAKTNIRDYHGKMAAHYWNSSTDIFQKPDSRTVAAFPQRRRTQRYNLPSLILSRSRSQELFQLEFTLPHSTSQEAMNSYV